MTLCGTRTRVTAGKRRLPGAVLQYNLSAAVAGSSAATTKGMSILAGFCNQASYMQGERPDSLQPNLRATEQLKFSCVAFSFELIAQR
jgi:hypothetical protein